MGMTRKLAAIIAADAGAIPLPVGERVSPATYSLPVQVTQSSVHRGEAGLQSQALM